MWEVDWTKSKPGNINKWWARNQSSHIPRTREWHWVSAGYLRQHGINTPVYRKDSWEIDWEKRDGKKVWARNPMSKMPKARDWHWIDHKTLDVAGLRWQPKNARVGRWIGGDGYVTLCRSGMTTEDVELAQRFGLFRGTRRMYVKEHRLVAVKKYGFAPAVVRHVNGVKHDNRPENIVGGTTQDNTADHNTARLEALYWRDRYFSLLRGIQSRLKFLMETAA